MPKQVEQSPVRLIDGGSGKRELSFSFGSVVWNRIWAPTWKRSHIDQALELCCVPLHVNYNMPARFEVLLVALHHALFFPSSGPISMTLLDIHALTGHRPSEDAFIGRFSSFCPYFSDLSYEDLRCDAATKGNQIEEVVVLVVGFVLYPAMETTRKGNLPL
ncbi:hypothetical protein NL676_002910 [Syzygium grande]|nr:hypothetical protein NL676_002910 [Syzygium grande]